MWSGDDEGDRVLEEAVWLESVGSGRSVSDLDECHNCEQTLATAQASLTHGLEKDDGGEEVVSIPQYDGADDGDDDSESDEDRRRSRPRSQSRRMQCTDGGGDGEDDADDAPERAVRGVEERAKKSEDASRSSAEKGCGQSQGFATINCAGYMRHIIRETGGDRLHAQALGVHEGLETFLKKRTAEGKRILFLALQETWIRKGEEMFEIEGYVVFSRPRESASDSGIGGRRCGGVAFVVAEEIAWRTEMGHGLGYGGSEGVIWQLVDRDKETAGAIGNVYFDSNYYRRKHGIDAETMWVALEWETKAKMEEGFVILMGDFNARLGREEDGAGRGEEGVRRGQRLGEADGKVPKRDGAGVCAGEGRR
jgi:hypothetical protein